MFARKAGWIGITIVAMALVFSAGCKKRTPPTAGDPLNFGGPNDRFGESTGLTTEDLGTGWSGYEEGLYDGTHDTLGAMPAGEKTQLSELRTVYFDFDRADLRPDQVQVLAENAAFLVSKPNLSVEIQGHCDERGTPEYNLSLGERRALTVRSKLIELGVDASRLYTVSYGKEVPAVLGSTEEAYSQNRRAEFWVGRM